MLLDTLTTQTTLSSSNVLLVFFILPEQMLPLWSTDFFDLFACFFSLLHNLLPKLSLSVLSNGQHLTSCG